MGGSHQEVVWQHLVCVWGGSRGVRGSHQEGGAGGERGGDILHPTSYILHLWVVRPLGRPASHKGRAAYST